MDDVTPADARAALQAVDHARAQVADEVGLPRWYWWLLAAAWVLLGVVGDLGPHWLAIAATLGFGLLHSTVASAASADAAAPIASRSAPTPRDAGCRPS